VTPAGQTGPMLVMDEDRAQLAPAPGVSSGRVSSGRVSSGRVADSGRRRSSVEAGRARAVAVPATGTRHGPFGPDQWEPLAGADLLERLRITGRPRPQADPDLTTRLRDGLEQGLLASGCPGPQFRPSDGVAHREPIATLVVTKDRLTRALSGEVDRADIEFGRREPTMAMACGAIVDVLFRQLVTVGSIGDPMGDGLAALAVDDRQAELVSWIERMPRPERDGLRAEVERQADGLLRRWPVLEPAWLPRTQESLRVGLAGGAVELAARVDLAVGRPAEDRASVAIVEVKSGVRRVEHRADLHFYALIEALRSPAPPFVVATYYTRTGELDVDPVTEELLATASRRALAGTRLLRQRANGSGHR
jgi:hypothetical protein